MSKKSRAFIFDIDGVLSNPSHRIEHAINKNWDAFNDLMHLDKANEDACEMCRHLNEEYDVVFLTGRPDKYRETTKKWLSDNVFKAHKYQLKLWMRSDGDLRSSAEFKLSAYRKISREYKIVAAFDDNEKVVAMFRKEKVTCFSLSSMYNQN